MERLEIGVELRRSSAPDAAGDRASVGREASSTRATIGADAALPARRDLIAAAVGVDDLVDDLADDERDEHETTATMTRTRRR